ncbi:hypothetical protein Efla_005565 [Eimeria flavescens]
MSIAEGAHSERILRTRQRLQCKENACMENSDTHLQTWVNCGGHLQTVPRNSLLTPVNLPLPDWSSQIIRAKWKTQMANNTAASSLNWVFGAHWCTLCDNECPSSFQIEGDDEDVLLQRWKGIKSLAFLLSLSWRTSFILAGMRPVFVIRDRGSRAPPSLEALAPVLLSGIADKEQLRALFNNWAHRMLCGSPCQKNWFLYMLY